MFQTLSESDPLSISDMSIKDVVTRPFVAKRLISTGRNLSLSPSVARPNNLSRSKEHKVHFKLDIDPLA